MGREMRIICYCDECTKCFENMPLFYWTMYENIVQEMIVYQRFYPLISVLDPDLSYTDEFLRRLETVGLISSCERSKELLMVRANGIHYMEQERPDVDLYQVCLNIDAHHIYELDENMIED